MKDTAYNRMLMATAQYEIEQLKKSGQEFVLDKELFYPNRDDSCIYGQVFGTGDSDAVREFRTKNSIPQIFFMMYETLKDENGRSALEVVTAKLWDRNKERVYKIVELFATWKPTDQPTVDTSDLFTLETL